jgi:membrane protein YdbS with pleckstrin-like domain
MDPTPGWGTVTFVAMRGLVEGETVAVDVRPHWWYLAGPVTALALVIAGAVAALVEGVAAWVDWVVVMVLAAAVVWMLGRYLRWVTTRMVVTSTRIVERRGVLGRSGREIPLSALTDISYHQTIFDRVIGAGDVLIESAGRDGREVFPDLPHPASIHNEIHALMCDLRAPSVTRAPSIPEQIDQLDQLRRRGVITEAEFEAKKTELLRRL